MRKFSWTLVILAVFFGFNSYSAFAEDNASESGVYLLESISPEYLKSLESRSKELRFNRNRNLSGEVRPKSANSATNEITRADLSTLSRRDLERVRAGRIRDTTMHYGGVNFDSQAISWEKQVITVAFNGGSEELRNKIATVATKWTQDPGVNVQFSFRDDAGRFREWSITDTDFKADVRVGFHERGVSSLIGNDSINRLYAKPNKPSLILENFSGSLPMNWEVLVLHEFGHALGFLHEYQNPNSHCQAQLRWDDDPGYIALRFQGNRQYIENNGKRPGAITYLSGYPNYWPAQMTRKNLSEMTVTSESTVVSAFDPASIMRYPLPSFLFKDGAQSGCFSNEIIAQLSPGDIEGLKKLYPRRPAEISRVLERKIDILETLSKKKNLPLDSKQFYINRLNNSVDTLRKIRSTF